MYAPRTALQRRADRRQRAGRSPDAGFTLVELLVVIIIIGIIVAIAIPAFLNQRAKSYDASVRSQLRSTVPQIDAATLDTPRGALVTKGADGRSIRVLTDVVDIPTTSGVQWTVAGTGNAYCLSGWRTGSKFTAAQPLVYASYEGGFLAPGESCSPAITIPAAGGSAGGFSVPVKNLLANGSFEVSHYSWIGSVTPTATTVPDAFSGSKVLRIAGTYVTKLHGTTAPSGDLLTVEAVPGQRHMISFYARKVSGSVTGVRLNGGGYYTAAGGSVGNLLYAATSNTYTNIVNLPEDGSWVRVTESVLNAAPVTAGRMTFSLYTTGGTGTIDIDAVMVTAGTAVMPYFDGDTTGARWLGTPHMSQSEIG